jgi:3-methylfumaryl-CoA hydratase
MTSDADLAEWIGRETTVRQRLDRWPAEALLATIRSVARPTQPDRLPLLAHWAYFCPTVSQSDLGEDGHPARGNFLPPIGLPRRMWAGGRLNFCRTPRFDTAVTRRSIIRDVRSRSGRSGRLILVTLEHVLSDDEGSLLTEEQDIVYREAPTGEITAVTLSGPSRPVPSDGWRKIVTPNPILLFRYSALTFNAHRIHYDRDYALLREGYPGLVVQGPLLATLLLDELERAAPDFDVGAYSFRALRPIFDTADFEVGGAIEADRTTARLHAIGPAGELCMEAVARRRPVKGEQRA